MTSIQSTHPTAGDRIVLARVWSLQSEADILYVCAPEDYAAMQREFELTVHAGPEPVGPEALIAGIPGYEAIITGWGGYPTLTAEFFEAADRLADHLPHGPAACAG